MSAKNDFESRFYDMLQASVQEVRSDIKKLSGKVDQNTKVTNSISTRVDKLDGKVFGKKQNSLANLLQDRQVVVLFVGTVFVFLLIVAAYRGIKLPPWL